MEARDSCGVFWWRLFHAHVLRRKQESVYLAVQQPNRHPSPIYRQACEDVEAGTVVVLEVADFSVSSATAQSSSLSSSPSPSTDSSDIKNVKQMQQSIIYSSSANQKLEGLLQQMILLRERLDGLENKFKEATVKSATSSTTTVPTSTTSQRGFIPRGRDGSYRGRYNFRKGRYSQRGAFQQQQQPASDTKIDTTKASSGSDKKADGSVNPLN